MAVVLRVCFVIVVDAKPWNKFEENTNHFKFPKETPKMFCFLNNFDYAEWNAHELFVLILERAC